VKFGRRSSTVSRGSRSQPGRLDLVAKPVKRLVEPPARGWTTAGGGSSTYLQPPVRWRGTSVQVCGLWPFATGSGAPMVGVPIGRSLISDATVCCDPISWFMRAKLISNPSMFLLGKPGLGKSTVVRRMVLGLAGFGVQPLILGDLKPDFRDLIVALGGQVIDLAPGRGHLNILDPGEAMAAADRLTGSARTWLIDDARQRRANMVSGLITILRAGVPPTDREEAVIGRALEILDDRHDGVPVLRDLLAVVQEAPADVRQAALDRGDINRYRSITEDLEATLQNLANGKSRLGTIFTEQTTQPMRRDSPVTFDLSGIDEAQTDLQAAALLACWSTGFATVNVAQVLADAGLEPRRNYFVVLDELWRALRSGGGIVDRIDALTRLNRQRGVGQAMVSHTMSDLLALPDEEDRMKAKGFVERAGMVICGGLPRAEMAHLTDVVALTDAEISMITSWQDPPAWSAIDAEDVTPPGLGNFLIKVGGRTGIPIHVDLTPVELALNDTNKRWRDAELNDLAVDADEVLGDEAGGALEEVS
jgi:hypothetical protein